MIVLDDLVQEVQRAYQSGKAKAGAGGYGYQEYEFQIQNEIQQWDGSFLPVERTIRDIFSELLRTTIKTIREGDLSRAEGLLASMRGIIRQGRLSNDSRCVCTSFLEAAAAYLDYKLQRYDQAIARLQEALALDEEVEQRNPDFAFLHLHRIMLLDNWIRALAHCRKAHEAIRLAFQALDYLEGKVHSLSMPTTWDSSRLSIYPDGALNILFRTITMEIAEIATGRSVLDDAGETISLREVFAHNHHLPLYDSRNGCHLSQASHDWIGMKQAALGKNIPVFLQYVELILAAGPMPVARPTFWNATVVEFMLVSREMPECENDILQEFRAEVVQDMTTSSRVPPVWKAIITGA